MPNDPNPCPACGKRVDGPHTCRAETPSAVEVALGRFLWRFLHDGVGLNGDDHLATINDVVLHRLNKHTDIGEAWLAYQSALAALATPGMPDKPTIYPLTPPPMRAVVGMVRHTAYEKLEAHATELAAIVVAQKARIERLEQELADVRNYYREIPDDEGGM